MMQDPEVEHAIHGCVWQSDALGVPRLVPRSVTLARQPFLSQANHARVDVQAHDLGGAETKKDLQADAPAAPDLQDTLAGQRSAGEHQARLDPSLRGGPDGIVHESEFESVKSHARTAGSVRCLAQGACAREA